MLYRAIPVTDHRPDQTFFRRSTLRPPSNLSYLTDNILEYTRPVHMPSRRHATYASPSPELALKNASARTTTGYMVCEVVIEGDYRIAQLKVSDARYHRDTRAIPCAVNDYLGEGFWSLPLSNRSPFASLFMPCMTARDIGEVASALIAAGTCVRLASEASTFWADASAEISPSSDGELFFELSSPDARYRLRPL